MVKTLVLHLTRTEGENPRERLEKERINLRFRIRQTKLAERWAALLKQDLPYGVRENNRFCGFYRDPKESIEREIRRINFLIERLKPLYPEIDFGKIDWTDIQKEVNRLHVRFADRHIVKKDLTKQSFQYWNDLNVALHQMEAYLSDMRNNSQPFPCAEFTVTFHNQQKQDLSDKDYENAVLNRTFGQVYLNYSQVGRHIMELYQSKDETLPLEHIRPFNKMSSDFFVHFGPSYGHELHLSKLKKVKKWFFEREKQFSQIGLSWDPQKLRLGQLPVAHLEEPLLALKEIKAFLKKMARFQKVESVEAL